MKRLFCFFALLLCSYTVFSQASKCSSVGIELGTLDQYHYIPPVYARAGYIGTGSIDKNYLVLSTPSISNIVVTIRNSMYYKNSGSSLAINQTRTISKTTPAIIDISAAPYGTSGYGSLNIVSDSEAGKVDSVNGLILSSTAAFYANIRHSCGAQGNYILAKGRVAIGKRFRSGHIYNNNFVSNQKSKSISVMALDDATQVTISDLPTGMSFVNSPSFPVTLDKYETFTLAAKQDVGINNTLINQLNGALITSTKPIVVNSGSWLGGAEGGGRDIGIDQIVPTSYAGTNFFISKGSGSINMEVPIVVADQNNTDIFINGSGTKVSTINAGDYYAIYNQWGTDSTMFITTSKPVNLYQSTGSNGTNGNGINYMAPLNLSLEEQEIIIADADQIGASSIYILTQSSGVVTVDGTILNNGVTMGANPNYKLYKIDGKTSNVSITCDQPYFCTNTVLSGARGAACSYVGFPNSFAVKDFYSIDIDSTFSADVISNDVQAIYDFKVDTICDTPKKGTAIIQNGKILYTPFPSSTGCDTLKYAIYDSTYKISDATYAYFCIKVDVSIDTFQNVSCHNANDGSVKLKTAGGFPPYTYSCCKKADYPIFSALQTFDSFENLASNDYIFRAIDFNGNSDTIHFTLSQPEVLNIVLNSFFVNKCHNDSLGSAFVSASGGNGRNQFSLYTNTLPYRDYSDSSYFYYLPANTYKSFVRDTLGCIDSLDMTITHPAKLEVNIDSVLMPSCFGLSDGTIKLSASGGMSPYLFKICDTPCSTFNTDSAFTNLISNNYLFHIQDSNNCEDTISVYLQQPNKLISNVLRTNDVICFGETNGFMKLQTNGGTAPYQYSIKPISATTFGVSQSFDSFSMLRNDTFVVMTNDTNNCIDHDTAVIDMPTNFSIIYIIDSANCRSAANGRISFSINGQNGFYKYSHCMGNGCSNFSNTQISNVFSNLIDTTYTIKIEDTFGCDTIFSLVVPKKNRYFSISTDSVKCNGLANGKLTISGRADESYWYSICSGNGCNNYSTKQSSSTFLNLAANHYSIKVEDSLACEYILQDTVFEPLVLSGTTSILDCKCNNDNTGKITITPSGGTSPYLYSLCNGSNCNSFSLFQNLDSFTNLVSGNYSILIQDQNLCSDTLRVFVNQPNRLSIVQDSIFDAYCFGSPTGRSYFSGTGGTAPYSYKTTLFSTKSTIISTDSVNSNLYKQNYMAYIYDVNQCKDSVFFAIGEKDKIYFNYKQTKDIMCFNDSNASIEMINISGGSSPYRYSLESINGTYVRPFQFSSIFDKLHSDDFVLFIQDSFGCSDSLLFNISQPTLLTGLLFPSPPKCNESSDGYIASSVQGGTSPYRYLWNTGDIKDSLLNKSKGVYFLTITDDNSCSLTLADTLRSPNFKFDSIILKQNNCYGIDKGGASIYVSGGNSLLYLYSVDSQSFGSSNTFVDLSSGEKTIYVVDANNCIIDSTVVFDTFQSIVNYYTSKDTTINLTESIDLIVDLKNYDFHSILWSPDLGLNCIDCLSPTASPYAPIEYTFEINYNNDCIESHKISININDNTNIWFPSAFSPNGDLKNDSWGAYSSIGLLKFELSVYNRLGEKIFHTNTISNKWDGTFKGEIQKAGVYSYYCTATTLSNKNTVFSGEILLIR